MSKLPLILLCSLFACASLAQAGPKEDAQKAIAAAEATNTKVGKVGFQWRDTGKIIKKAKNAVASKDYKKAVKLASKAETQGKLAYIQYETEMVKKKY